MNNRTTRFSRKRLEEFRAANDITIEEAAKKIGISNTGLVNIEKGITRRPNARTLYKIRKAFPELFGDAA